MADRKYIPIPRACPSILIYGEVTGLITADPGLPRSNPTPSYWQHVPHPLASTQSASLPNHTDYAVIGSGITGLSVALTLLESDLSATVTVLEARTLCSGATGRNGGQLAANAGEEYLHLARVHGAERAGQIVRFTLRNLERMRDLVNKYAPDASELQDVQKLRVFQTPDTFADFEESIAALERDHPSLKGLYTIISTEQLKEEYKMDGAGGALLRAGTVWPYRLITQTFASLLEKYPSRLSIETNTPVTGVDVDSGSGYTVQTSRGSLRAGKIAYCTNGYTGHLLPRLRGPIFPFKGTMTVQDPGPNTRNCGKEISWGFHYPAVYDETSNIYSGGLYYLLQSARTGYFYFGGEHTKIENCLSSDDTEVDEGSIAQLREKLARFLGEDRSREPWAVVSAWSGVMGFSADGLPVVGRLPASVTEREGEGEYIAAAFNGYGMPNCLLCGEALARFMMGKNEVVQLPEAYGINEDRLKNLLTVENSVGYFTVNSSTN
ncbi:hypothetical protein ARAM_001586 [Aspergillus rambellii]|uniref:FAD dependent oxidoreductase domain-containing protein n=1 Tax=Aspergillus rambellii TaxID=308745 RepID=A0A0F8VST3_9EURO|nr:hypothetical protein ARAM_001586 [Aspergillus rambellii]